MKRVFLDAACWVAAAGSETGGSSAILLLAQALLIVIVTSRDVLHEAERSIQAKLGMGALKRFYSIPVQDTKEFLTELKG